MIFRETSLQGAFVIDLEKQEDFRGFNSRAWCQEEFEGQGLESRVVQTNIIFNKKRGTLRGLHYQIFPHEESKIFRCTRGAVYCVIVDLRRGSDTFRNWTAVELADDKYISLYVPRSFALGSLSLVDNTEMTYQVSELYRPSLQRGIRYDDPSFAIKWPASIEVISEKDRNWPNYRIEE